MPQDLYAIQAELEKEMTAKGAEKFYRHLAYKKEAQQEDGTIYGASLMRSKVDQLAQCIADWKAIADAGRPGRKSAAVKLLRDVDNHVLAFLTLKCVLGQISAIQTEQAVAIKLAEMVEEEILFDDLRRQDNKVVTDTLEKGRHSRNKIRKKAYALRAFRMADMEINDKWTRQDKLLVGILLISLVELNLDLIQIDVNRMGPKKTVRNIRAKEGVQDWIQKVMGMVAYCRPTREPMVVPPRDWSTPYDGGYLTSNIAPMKMVKVKNRNYLEELCNTEMPLIYEGINAAQRSAWQINSQVLQVMQHVVDQDVPLGGYPDSTADLPFPAKLDASATKEEKLDFMISRARVGRNNHMNASLRISYHMGLDIAKRYNKFKEIYFPYQLDFRGRIYAVPYLNPQSADHHKGLLRFAYGKALGEEGWKWLAIHGANVAGYDKASLEDRVRWVQDNEEEILAIAKDPYGNTQWGRSVGGVSIDKPWQFLAFCFEWAGYCEHGNEYISKIPIALDGSCSGIQHFSAMLRDEIGGKSVNLVPSDLPEDVYQRVADVVIEQLKHDALYGDDFVDKTKKDGNIVTIEGSKTLARQWLEFGVDRKTTKRCVMTMAYGSRQYGFKENIFNDILKPAYQESIKGGQVGSNTKMFPFSFDGFMAAAYLAGVIWAKVQVVLVKAAQAMEWLTHTANVMSKSGLPLRWTSPAGFPVLQEYYEEKVRRIHTNLNGKSVEFYIKEPLKKISKAKQAQGSSPNFVHSCDAAHMMLTLARGKQEGIRNFAMIHDSFGTTAGDTARMFYLVRETFVEMYSHVDAFENFRSEILAQLPEDLAAEVRAIPAKGTLDIQQVTESQYCFA